MWVEDGRGVSSAGGLLRSGRCHSGNSKKHDLTSRRARKIINQSRHNNNNDKDERGPVLCDFPLTCG